MANTPKHDDTPKSDQSKKPAGRPGPASGSTGSKPQQRPDDKGHQSSNHDRAGGKSGEDR